MLIISLKGESRFIFLVCQKSPAPCYTTYDQIVRVKIFLNSI